MVAANAEFGYDRIIGPELFEIAIDGSLHTAFCGGEVTGQILWWGRRRPAASPPDKGTLGSPALVRSDGVPTGGPDDATAEASA